LPAREGVTTQRKFRLTFEKGLLRSQEASMLPAGTLVECDNLVPDPLGGLRTRAGWKPGSRAGLSGTLRGRGIGLFSRATDPVIAQVSSVVHTSITASASVTPTFTWASPTRTGSTLVLLIAVANNDTSPSGSVSATAAGWNPRTALALTSGGNGYGWYDLMGAASQSGDVQPVVITRTAAGAGDSPLMITAWLVELSGVASSSFDASGTGSGTTTANATATSGVTTQASEILLGFVAAREASSAGFTYSTASSGWSVQTQGGQAVGSAWQQGAIFTKVVRATGAHALTATSSDTDTDRADLMVATYKGWNAAASPPDRLSEYLVALDDTSAYDVWAIDRDDVDAGTFAAVVANVGSTTTASELVAFTRGLGATWYTAPSFTGVRRYDGQTEGAVANSPVGARCIAVYKERLWATSGTRLFWSQAGDGEDWTDTLGAGYVDIKADDGEDIEDIVPFGDVLVIVKRTSTFALVGDDPSTFTPVALTGGGAARGRPLVATPYGCVIAGTRTVYLWDGEGAPEPISEGVEGLYDVPEGTFVSTSFIDKVAYVCVQDTGQVFAFDLARGIWWTETVADAAEAPAVLYNFGDRQLYAPRAGVEVGALNFRDTPHPDRIADHVGLTVGESFAATTPDLWLAGPDGRFTVN
jgi:hypothetical protein